MLAAYTASQTGCAAEKLQLLTDLHAACKHGFLVVEGSLWLLIQQVDVEFDGNPFQMIISVAEGVSTRAAATSFVLTATA